MDPEKQRTIASKGGRAAHEAGTAHEFTSEEARIAGSKGGEVVSEDRAHMAAIGSRGGQSHGQNARMKVTGLKEDVSTRAEKAGSESFRK